MRRLILLVMFLCGSCADRSAVVEACEEDLLSKLVLPNTYSLTKTESQKLKVGRVTEQQVSLTYKSADLRGKIAISKHVCFFPVGRDGTVDHSKITLSL